MEGKYHFTNLACVSLKNYSDSRREKILKSIEQFASQNGLRFIPYQGGFVMQWKLAKQFVKNFHFDLGRIFGMADVGYFMGANLVTEDDVKAAEIA